MEHDDAERYAHDVVILCQPMVVFTEGSIKLISSSGSFARSRYRHDAAMIAAQRGVHVCQATDVKRGTGGARGRQDETISK